MLDALENLAATASAPAESDRHIAEPVHPPAFWQAWLRGAGGGRWVAPDELLVGAARLVVAAPHPDDELLMCGGLMQAALAHGMALCIVSVTDGEACFGANADRMHVGAVRRAEARAGLLTLGAGNAPLHRLAVGDGEVSAHEAQVQRALRALLQPGDLVVAPWRLDGHPDHDATGRAAATACAHSGARLLEAPVWMWHWAVAEHPAVPWSRLRCCALTFAHRARKHDALACHRSQLAPRDRQPPVVDQALQARAAWPFETFFLP